MKKLIIVITVSLLIMTLYSRGYDIVKEDNYRMKMDNSNIMNMDHMKNDAKGNMCGMGNNMKNMHGNRKSLIESLELNKEQTDQVSKLQYQYELDIIDIETDLKKSNIEEERAEKMNDFAKVKDLNLRISSQEAQLMNKQVELHEEIFKLLDEDQKGKWENSDVQQDCCMKNDSMEDSMDHDHMGKW
jgi:Spy/CpxP family protein refolding chaperone